MCEDVRNRLQAYWPLGCPTHPQVRINQVTNITSGWESEVYSFDAEHGSAGPCRTERLILRLYPGQDARTKSAHEYQAIYRLHEAGYPVPRVLLLEQDPSHFGNPFVIMDRIEGQPLWRRLVSSAGPRQAELLTLFCELLVRLHRLELPPLVDDLPVSATDTPYAAVDRWLDLGRDALARSSLPDALRVVDWLQARRHEVPCARLTPTHGDFHPDNVLLRADDSGVVIDWTQFAVSDPRFDLAWAMLLMGTYEGWSWRERILEGYERLTGAAVPQIEWFEVCACGRRLHNVLISLAEGAEKLGMRPGAVEMMKQQGGALQRVGDLLEARTGIKLAEAERFLASLA